MIPLSVIKAALGKILKGIPIQIWYALGILLFLFFFGLFWHHRGYTAGVEEWKPKALAVQKAFNDFKASVNELTKAREDEDRRRYKEQQAKNAQATNELNRKNKDVQDEANSTINDLRHGNLQLRKGLVQCQSNSGRKDQAPTASSGSDAAGGGELSPTLERFLVGEASRADKVVNKLTACQALVESYSQ